MRQVSRLRTQVAHLRMVTPAVLQTGAHPPAPPSFAQGTSCSHRVPSPSTAPRLLALRTLALAGTWSSRAAEPPWWEGLSRSPWQEAKQAQP